MVISKLIIADLSLVSISFSPFINIAWRAIF